MNDIERAREKRRARIKETLAKSRTEEIREYKSICPAEPGWRAVMVVGKTELEEWPVACWACVTITHPRGEIGLRSEVVPMTSGGPMFGLDDVSKNFAYLVTLGPGDTLPDDWREYAKEIYEENRKEFGPDDE